MAIKKSILVYNKQVHNIISDPCEIKLKSG